MCTVWITRDFTWPLDPPAQASRLT
uniref:Uncharacterized protein n=1 Tax=Arundo donax TaxID=35708 RepID=A0A0A9AUA1_ARUDO